MVPEPITTALSILYATVPPRRAVYNECIRDHPLRFGAGSAQFTTAVPKDLTRHNQAVDLACAFVNVRDLRVTEPLLCQEFPAVTQRTEDLNRPLCDLRGYVTGLHLAHRGFEHIGLLIVSHPDGLQNHEPGGLQHDLHVNDLALHITELLAGHTMADLH